RQSKIYFYGSNPRSHKINSLSSDTRVLKSRSHTLRPPFESFVTTNHPQCQSTHHPRPLHHHHTALLPAKKAKSRKQWLPLDAVTRAIAQISISAMNASSFSIHVAQLV